MNTNVTARRTATKAKPSTAPAATKSTPSKRGTHRTKKSGSNGPAVITAGIVVLVLALYGFGIITPSGFQDSETGSLNHPAQLEHHPKVAYSSNNVRKAKAKANPYEGSTNPYEGWQPLNDLAQDTGGARCKSWRTCFKGKQNPECAARCRESKKDFGKAPPRPGFVPDPTKSEEENAEAARAVPWVPDVTVLNRMLKAGVDEHGNPWPPPLVTAENKELCEAIGNSGGPNDDNRMALRKFPIAGGDLRNPENVKTRVMCLVYTMEENHAKNIRAIRETWGPGCDGFLAFSTRDDPRLPAISIPHDGEESYNNMWQKVRSIWRFVGTHYLEDFDFFFQGGEDLYVLPQNLRSYLAEAVDDPTKDDFFGGRRFKWGRQDIYFNSGGAGYALSQATLRKLVNEGLDHDDCFPTKHSAMEDVFIARCLKDVFDIDLVDTRDAQERERFHPFAPAAHYNWNPPAKDGPKDWYELYNRPWPNKLREMCCAPDSVSFHYMKRPAMVRHIHSLIYSCPADEAES